MVLWAGYAGIMKAAHLSPRDELLKRLVKDGLKIQHRFKPEPVFAKTGKGHMDSEGVGTLARIKNSLRAKK